jgi:hypothetical protein
MKKEDFAIFENAIKNFSRKNRKYIFAYFDTETEMNLTNYFKINNEHYPKLIVYDFINKAHYIDDQGNFDNKNEKENEENLIKNLKNVILKIEENSLVWSYGSFIQNIFSKFGLNLSEKNLVLLLMCIFGLILFFFIFSLFCCGDSEEITEEAKRDFMQKLAYNEDLNEEEKNMIVNSRNFNSFVKMGVEKIVEAIKGQREENNINDDDDNNENENDNKNDNDNDNDNDIINNENRIEEERKIEDNLNKINDIKDFKEKKND